MKKYLDIALGGVSRCGNHLVVDHLNHVETKLALQGLLINLGVIDSGDLEDKRFLKWSLAPSTSEFRSCNGLRHVGGALRCYRGWCSGGLATTENVKKIALSVRLGRCNGLYRG